jgi:hypothetical protein
MPTLRESTPAPGELTDEQKERTDAEYIAEVNKGIAAAVKQADAGALILAEKDWAELSAEEPGASRRTRVAPAGSLSDC